MSLLRKSGTLEGRFFDFASELEGCELIDKLRLTRPQHRNEKADLFFENRTIVAEVKSLAKDTSEKVEPILEPYRGRDDFPVFFGTWPLEDVFNQLEDGEEVKGKVYHAVTSAIPDLVRKANRQIRSTKKTFHKPKAKGLLIILNDLVGILTPEIISHAVHRTLMKKNPNRTWQFTEVVYAWIISESHFIQITPTLRGIPAIMMNHGGIEAPRVEAFVNSLQPKWAEYNQVPLIDLTADGSLPNFPYQEAEKLRREEERITRSEFWRRQYRESPYLSALGKDELLAYGAKLVHDVGKLFLVGSTSTREERMHGIERCGHFFEEINVRRIDMRDLKPHLESIGPPTLPDQPSR